MKTPTQKIFFGCDSSLFIIIKIPVGQSQPTVRHSSSRNAREKYTAPMIHPHHCSKILFQNEDSHSKTFFRVTHHYHHQKYRLVNPNLRYDKTYHQQYVGTPEKKKIEASTIHPHHSSKLLFQNEDSHSKTFFGCDSSLLSSSKYRLVNPNLRYDKTYQQQ